MGYFSQRDEPVTVLLAQVWDRRPSARVPYHIHFRGYTWPTIEFVPVAGDVPSHGIFHGPEGDIVINHGDYITLYPPTSRFGASSWYGFVGFYEEALNAPT